MIESIVNQINEFLWGYILIYALLGVGIYFTIYLKGIQFVRFKPAIKQLFGRLYDYKPNVKDGENVSSFQALAVAISAQVGTGNVAGVATAIMAGGPGAIFWMWISAFLGMATIFVEAVLSQQYKKESVEAFIGGPAYYISKGLKRKIGRVKADLLAGFFAIAIIVALGFIGNMVQSNSIAMALENAFDITPLYTGIAIAIVAGLIIVGGIQRIANFAQYIVPVMAAVYILCSIVILCMFYEYIPQTVMNIIVGAFTPEAIGGGALGVTMKEAIRYGISRGLFSNEAGMGSTPHAHASAFVAHPVLQGFTAFIGVFVDTVIICTATALIIMATGANQMGIDGALVTQQAFEIAFGPFGPKLIAICLIFFAFTTIIGWYYFGESNVTYLFENKMSVSIYRILVLGCIVIGTLGKVDLVWSLSDLFNGIMVIPNLIGIILLRKEVKKLLYDYDHRRQDGVPVYHFPKVKKLRRKKRKHHK